MPFEWLQENHHIGKKPYTCPEPDRWGGKPVVEGSIRYSLVAYNTAEMNDQTIPRGMLYLVLRQMTVHGRTGDQQVHQVIGVQKPQGRPPEKKTGETYPEERRETAIASQLAEIFSKSKEKYVDHPPEMYAFTNEEVAKQIAGAVGRNLDREMRHYLGR